MRKHPASSAPLDFVVARNASMVDAVQFDPPVPGVTGPDWSFTGQSFRMDVAANYATNSALLTLTSDDGEIVVEDAVQRILSWNVPQTTIQAALIPGTYVYDLIMYETADPTVRVQIAHGKYIVADAITGG